MPRLWGRIAVFSGVLLCTSARAQDAVRAGGVSALAGNAVAVRGVGENDLALNDPIFTADVPETGPTSKLRVTFADDTQLTLGPNADVVIDEFVYAPDKKTGNAAIRIAAGTARILAGAIEDNGGQGAFAISTPVATIGIRGTDFFVEMDGDHL